MPTESNYPKLDVPNVDLWAFLFERKDREFPDDKGMLISICRLLNCVGIDSLLYSHRTPPLLRAPAATNSMLTTPSANSNLYRPRHVPLLYLRPSA
jgi:hypothetical protein